MSDDRGIGSRASRRGFLLATALAPTMTLEACRARVESPSFEGGWVGASHDRGHLVRDGLAGAAASTAPVEMRRVDALVVGAGIAGLAAARSLAKAGIDDVAVLELEDEPGGNARGHEMFGLRCPLGAHYLPVPGEAAVETAELLDELGLRTVENGRAVYDERMLCLSPQERLFIDGGWRDGLLPPVDALPTGEREATLAAYRAFAGLVDTAGRDGAFAIPTARSRWSPALDALDATTFAEWLDRRGLVAPALRWYLDYCCRDDYGAAASQVSAWAGLHYFASRHGFRPPGGDDARGIDEGLLTWPEGNAYLAARLSAPLGARLARGRVVHRVREERDEVVVEAWQASERRLERWRARQVVLAVPLFVASRVLVSPPAELVDAARRARYAPWLVADLYIDRPLDDRPGAPPSWDNVLYGSPSLGYVDATHQSLKPVAGATVLTAYWALGGSDAQASAAARAALLADDWRAWSMRVVADLSAAHPDLAAKVRRVDLMRYGHAMSIPVPGVRSAPALQRLAGERARVQFAHADLSAYSVFEEAYAHGNRAGRAAARRLRA